MTTHEHAYGLPVVSLLDSLTPTHVETLDLQAVLHGWAARPREVGGLTAIEAVDSISLAAGRAVLSRLLDWEAQRGGQEAQERLDAARLAGLVP